MEPEELDFDEPIAVSHAETGGFFAPTYTCAQEEAPLA